MVLSSELSISSTHVWTDSTVVLSWLTTHQRTFKIFVTNRIAKIHALLPECEWSYVNTTENPSDPASRSVLPHATVLCKVHQEGHPFLRLPTHQWPSRTFSTISPEQLPEYQPKLLTASVATVSSITLRDDIIQQFSSFTRMLRVLAYVKRLSFMAHKRKEISLSPLKQAELQTILIRVAYLTQQSHFPDLYRQLTASNGSMRPATLAQLTPFIDSSNLIRVGGRLRHASLDPDAKHPILQPKSSKLIELVIQHFHQGFLYAGPKLVLGMIRRKFWILSGRDDVRQYIFGCVKCVRHKAIRLNPIMGQLPSFRIQQHRPFNRVGLDYGGPFVIKESRRRNAKTSKSYLALFVCMTVKVVHLEFVTDMSTAA